MSSEAFKSPVQQVSDAKKKGVLLMDEEEDNKPMWKEMPVLYAGKSRENLLGSLTRSDTNHAVQPQKMIYWLENLD